MIPIPHAAELLISRRQNFPPNVTIFAEKGVSERVSKRKHINRKLLTSPCLFRTMLGFLNHPIRSKEHLAPIWNQRIEGVPVK